MQLSFLNHISPYYERSESGLSQNDLALIELVKPLQFGDEKVRPACLFDGNETQLPDYTMISAGFGEKEKVIHLNGSLKELTNRTERNPKRLTMTSLHQVEVNKTFLDALAGGEYSDGYIFATPSVLETSFKNSNHSFGNSTNSTTKPSVQSFENSTCLLTSG